MTDVTLEFALLPLAERVTLVVPAERAQATREALDMLADVQYAEWERTLRKERAGWVFGRA